MDEKSIMKVRKSIQMHGDSFWTDAEEGSDTNDVLFYDILDYLKKDGLTLKLVKLPETKKKSAA